MKKLNGKGVALAYTVMTMLLVFAMCALITTLVLAQITYFSAYSQKSKQKNLYSQIGDIFLLAKGDFFTCENDSLENDENAKLSYIDDEGAKTTPLSKELLTGGFDINSLHVVIIDLAEQDVILRWEGIKYGETIFSFELQKFQSDRTITIYDRNSDKRAKLIVTIRCNEDDMSVIEWNRGE